MTTGKINVSAEADDYVLTKLRRQTFTTAGLSHATKLPIKAVSAFCSKQAKINRFDVVGGNAGSGFVYRLSDNARELRHKKWGGKGGVGHGSPQLISRYLQEYGPVNFRDAVNGSQHASDKMPEALLNAAVSAERGMLDRSQVFDLVELLIKQLRKM